MLAWASVRECPLSVCGVFWVGVDSGAVAPAGYSDVRE